MRIATYPVLLQSARAAEIVKDITGMNLCARHDCNLRHSAVPSYQARTDHA